jgi:hypothetical protein
MIITMDASAIVRRWLASARQASLALGHLHAFNHPRRRDPRILYRERLSSLCLDTPCNVRRLGSARVSRVLAILQRVESQAAPQRSSHGGDCPRLSMTRARVRVSVSANGTCGGNLGHGRRDDGQPSRARASQSSRLADDCRTSADGGHPMPPSASATWPAAILINFPAPHGTRLFQNGHQAGPQSGRCLGLKHHLRVNPPASQAEIVSSQASSLRTGRSWTPAHVHGPGRVGRAVDGRHACDS